MQNNFIDFITLLFILSVYIYLYITCTNVLLFSGLNDPPSVPNRPKLDELSGQWTSLQVRHTKSFGLTDVNNP